MNKVILILLISFLFLSKEAWVSGVIPGNIELKKLIFKSKYIFVIKANPKNCKQINLINKDKEISTLLCQYEIQEVLRARSKNEIKLGSKVKIVAYDYIPKEIPEGKWAIEPTNDAILSPLKLNGSYIALLNKASFNSKESEIDGYVGALDFGLIDLKYKKEIKWDR